MGYSIVIGEAAIEYSNEYGDSYAYITAEGQKVNNAPCFGFSDISGKSNERSPGYGQMSDWCRNVGLYGLFFDKDDGILRHHPGCVPLEKRHLDVVIEAREKWYREHNDCVSKLPYSYKEPSNYKDMTWSEREKYEEEQDFDWMYARLIWYEWWFRWALKNCKKPAIYNYQN